MSGPRGDSGRRTPDTALRSTGRAFSWKHGVAALVLVIIVGVGTLIALDRGEPARPVSHAADDGTGAVALLTPDDRRPLEVVERDGERQLRHPALGFSVAHPGPGFQTLSGTQAERFNSVFAGDPAMQVYAYTDPATAEAFVVALGPGAEDREAFEAFCLGVRSAFESRVGPDALTSEVTWSQSVGRAAFDANTPEGASIRLRLHALPLGSQGRRYVVTVLGLTPAEGRLDAVVDSFRPGLQVP